MEKSKGHCLMMPDQLQGHINPMLQFSKRLAQKGVKITLAITRYTFKSMQQFSGDSISVETISDGYDDGWRGDELQLQEFVDHTREVGMQTMKEVVERLRNSGRGVDCVIYDPLIPWCLDVAKKMGLVGVAFFTQSCVVTKIYHHLYEGRIQLPFPENRLVCFPGLPPFEPSDMPSFMYEFGTYPAALKLMLDQFHNIKEADWILVNSFYKLEREAADWIAGMGKVRTIGPSIPSAYLDKRIASDREYGLSILKPSRDACGEWLGQRAPRSVVYVSFGSMAELGAEQMEALADGLRLSSYYFMWVVRPTQESKLPDGFLSEKGLVVQWCPQLEVLADEAVGCFITHCGWNSMLEALSLGVPMVGMPQWSDQTTNSKFVVDVWKMGIRAFPDQKGIVRKEEIVRCVKHVMEDEGGKEIRKTAETWKRLASEAVDAGGTSDVNIQEFISSIVTLVH